MTPTKMLLIHSFDLTFDYVALGVDGWIGGDGVRGAVVGLLGVEAVHPPLILRLRVPDRALLVILHKERRVGDPEPERRIQVFWSEPVRIFIRLEHKNLDIKTL